MKVTYKIITPDDAEDAIRELQQIAFHLRCEVWQCDICDKWIKYEDNDIDDECPASLIGKCKECQLEIEENLF